MERGLPQTETFEEAAAQCVEALEKQIKKRKTKIIGKRNDIAEIKKILNKNLGVLLF